ncbi:unnamed protein product [Polarella glacialis]|uniref:Uncharacterized protein n=1 Tax=Polarella glacialis TaxID=89957 RepID=A0A813KMV3_POLGL|nr:unnamed protein product [Polarella glacialis]
MVLCTNVPPGMLGELAKLGCQEFIKAKTFLGGQQWSALTTLAKQEDSPSSQESSSSSGSTLCQRAISDPARHQKLPTDTKDIQRLLCWVWTDGAVPDRFIETKCFVDAWNILQVELVGTVVVKLPNRRQLAKMKAIEAQQEVRDRSQWAGETEFGTLCLDGRKMSEGRYKEHLLNSAFASQGKEFYLNSVDMGPVKKDSQNTAESVEATCFNNPEAKFRLRRCNQHGQTEHEHSGDDAIVGEAPRHGHAGLRLSLMRWAGRPPCQGHHGFEASHDESQTADQILLQPVSSSQLYPQVGQQKGCKDHSVVLGRTVHPKLYLRIRNTRNYPLYYCVKRAYELNYAAAAYFSSSVSREECGEHRHFSAMKAITVQQRVRFMDECKIFRHSLRPAMVKLRKLDSTKIMFSQVSCCTWWTFGGRFLTTGLRFGPSTVAHL